MSNHTRLFNLLNRFNGAKETQGKSKEQNLLESFERIAKEMLYGGYIRVRNEYAIFISKVEFYYHEEKEVQGMRLTDDIVYHRDGRFLERRVPYFPMMTLHSHWSGFDITFEKESGHYRASALIRQYAVLDLNKKKFIVFNTSGKKLGELKRNEEYPPVGEIVFSDVPVIDKRSTFLQYFLNGFSMDGTYSSIEWRELDDIDFPDVKKEPRQNAEEHDWGYTFIDFEGYKDAIVQRTTIL